MSNLFYLEEGIYFKYIRSRNWKNMELKFGRYAVPNIIIVATSIQEKLKNGEQIKVQKC